MPCMTRTPGAIADDVARAQAGRMLRELPDRRPDDALGPRGQPVVRTFRVAPALALEAQVADVIPLQVIRHLNGGKVLVESRQV